MNPKQEFNMRCIRFSAGVLKLLSQMPKKVATGHVVDQTARSATSIGANVQEAQAAESRADFVHKLQIALKEAREVSYWLMLTQEAGLVQDPLLPGLVTESQQIAAILGRSVITAKANGGR